MYHMTKAECISSPVPHHLFLEANEFSYSIFVCPYVLGIVRFSVMLSGGLEADHVLHSDGFQSTVERLHPWAELLHSLQNSS